MRWIGEGGEGARGEETFLVDDVVDREDDLDVPLVWIVTLPLRQTRRESVRVTREGREAHLHGVVVLLLGGVDPVGHSLWLVIWSHISLRHR